MTTTASTLKLKAEISRIQQLLQANGVSFEEARCRVARARVRGSSRARRAAPATAHARHPRAAGQVDLSLEPGRRDEMVAVSNSRVLPQLHCDGQV